jgi:hypothetical protein
VTPRDVSDLRARLEAAATTAAALAGHLPDLHGLAYERHVGGSERVAGGDAHPGVENIGDERARDLWARLVKHAHHVELTLQALEWAVGNLLAAGASPEDTRGSLISSAEFAHAVRHQQQRAAAGEYTPVRSQDQPPYPGGGR